MRSSTALLLWMPIALLGSVAFADPIDDEAAAIKAKFPNVDVSLEGYDKNLVLDKRSGLELAPLHLRAELDDEALGVTHKFGPGVDVSLEGYDHQLLARTAKEEDPGLEDGPFELRGGEIGVEKRGFGSEMKGFWERMIGSKNEARDEKSAFQSRGAVSPEEAAARAVLGEGVDYSLAGYDHKLAARDLETESDTPVDEKVDIDYSLEGYDHDLVAASFKGKRSFHAHEYLEEPSSEENVPRAASEADIVESMNARYAKPSALVDIPGGVESRDANPGNIARAWSYIARIGRKAEE